MLARHIDSTFPPPVWVIVVVWAMLAWQGQPSLGYPQDEDEDAATNTQDRSSWVPKLQVQAKLTDDWHQPDRSSKVFSNLTSHRVIITAAWTTQENNSIPYSHRPIYLACAEKPLAIITQANGRFANTTLQKGVSQRFHANAAGRFSFTMPVLVPDSPDGLDPIQILHSFRTPPFFVRTDFMDPDEWVVVHPDVAAFHALSSGISADLIRSMNPSLPKDQVDVAVEVLKKLAAHTLHYQSVVVTDTSSGPAVVGSSSSRSSYAGTTSRQADHVLWDPLRQQQPYLPVQDTVSTYRFNATNGFESCCRRLVVPVASQNDTWAFSFSNHHHHQQQQPPQQKQHDDDDHQLSLPAILSISASSSQNVYHNTNDGTNGTNIISNNNNLKSSKLPRRLQRRNGSSHATNVSATEDEKKQGQGILSHPTRVLSDSFHEFLSASIKKLDFNFGSLPHHEDKTNDNNNNNNNNSNTKINHQTNSTNSTTTTTNTNKSNATTGFLVKTAGQKNLVVRTLDFAGKCIDWIIETVHDVVSIMIKVLDAMKIKIHRVVERIKSVFSWESILVYTTFLSHFARTAYKTLPSILHVKASSYSNWSVNASATLHKRVNQVAHFFGGDIHLNLEESFVRTRMPVKFEASPGLAPMFIDDGGEDTKNKRNSGNKNSSNNKSNSNYPSATPPLGVQATLIEDMYLNNAERARFLLNDDDDDHRGGSTETTGSRDHHQDSNNNNLVANFLKELDEIEQELFTSLNQEGLFQDDRTWSEPVSELLSFQDDESTVNVLVLRLMTMVDVFLQVGLRMTAVIVNKALLVIPRVYGLMLKISHVKLYVPLLYEFLDQIIFRNQLELNMFNLFCLLGSIHNFLVYKAFYADDPITRAELQVFLKETNPMYFKLGAKEATRELGPWTQSREKRVNRLLDWCPRGFQVYLTTNTLLLAYIVGGSSTLMPKVTIPPFLNMMRRGGAAILNWLIGNTIAPIEQVKDREPDSLYQVLYNLNTAYFVWYAVWTGTTIMRQIHFVESTIPKFIRNSAAFQKLSEIVPGKAVNRALALFRAIVVGIPRSIASYVLLSEFLRETTWNQTGRPFIATMNAGTYIFDALTHFGGLLPTPIATSLDISMVTAYVGRYWGMVGFDKVGVAKDLPMHASTDPVPVGKRV